MFSKAFKLDGKEFREKSSLAQHLKKNFRKSVTYLTDDCLYLFLKEELPDFYNALMELTKDFEHKENILTLLIYLLDNKAGIATASYSFKNNHDIADAMKKTYPNINLEIKTLFHDKVLAHIFWNEYQKTYDSSFKRNYTFMLHVYENRMYDFTYYYYLFLHLAKNEVVRFTLDGLKMKSLEEVCIHLSNNIDRASLIIEEILHNPFILAKMAIENGIDVVAATLSSKHSLEILKLLSTYASVDLTPIIRRKMAYWLLFNYQNYTYETEEAKTLYYEYLKINKDLSLSTLSDYIAIYDEVDGLYRRFILLFNHNKLIAFRQGINSEDDYYLNYRFNEEYVCKKFLIDNELYDENIHTDILRDSVEREVLVDALEAEKQEVIKFGDEVEALTKNLSFDKVILGKNLFVSIMYLLLLIVSMVGAIFIGLHNEDTMILYVNYGLFGLLCLALLLTVINVIRYSKKLNDVELIEVAMENSGNSIKYLCKEAETVLNPRHKDFTHSTLKELTRFRKNRKNDLQKIKKIANKKQTVSSFLLIASAFLAVLPILEFGLVFVLKLFNIVPYELDFGYGISILSLVFALLHLIMLIVLRKKRISYYLIYLYIAIVAVLSVLL